MTSALLFLPLKKVAVTTSSKELLWIQSNCKTKSFIFLGVLIVSDQLLVRHNRSQRISLSWIHTTSSMVVRLSQHNHMRLQIPITWIEYIIFWVWYIIMIYRNYRRWLAAIKNEKLPFWIITWWTSSKCSIPRMCFNK